MDGYQWMRFRACRAWGKTDWTYKEVSLDVYGSVDEAFEDKIDDYEDEYGDGIRGVEGELIDSPPEDHLRFVFMKNETAIKHKAEQNSRIILLLREKP